MKTPLLLAIDTSCDETSVAVVQGQKILSNVIASQVQLHKQYGGVFPTVAKQAHIENIEPTIIASLKRAGKTEKDLNGVIVTQGPGLAPALEIGIQKAIDLGKKLSIPVIPVNHIEGHILSVLAQANPRTKKFETITPQLPALSVIVSGGHTEFVLVEKIGTYKKLGWTLDDAAGECLDKVGRLLGLGYPAGALVEQLAQKGNAHRFEFPLPMTASRDFNMSFSGIKTHSRRHIKELEQAGELNAQTITDFCASLQYGVFRHILHKLGKLLEHTTVKELWFGGGVAANSLLKNRLRQISRQHKLTFRAPYSHKLCGDNAAMIGVAGSYHFTQENFHQAIDRKPQWSVENR